MSLCYRPYGVGEGSGRMRLRDKPGTRRQLCGARPDAAGPNQDADLGRSVVHGLRQAKTIQRAWHVHVREQHLHVGASFEERQRLLSARALEDGEASVFEHVSRDHAHEHFVLDEEDHERLVHQCILLPWSSRILQPAVIRSLGKSREGPGARMKSPAGSAERTRSYKRSSGCEGAKNESGRKSSKRFPHWAGFLSAAVFGRRVLSRASALSSSVSLEVSMVRLGSATSSRTTVTRR